MAEDLFDGAIGIDLGTTYSYAFSLKRSAPAADVFFFASKAALGFGKTTVSKSSPMTVCASSTHPFSFLPIITFQRVTARHHLTSLSLLRSASLVMPPKIRLR
jgi:hypothetical protein